MKSLFQFLSEAGTSQASVQARKLNLKSDGHGSWFDSRGKFVATTEDGRLKFRDKKKTKDEEETGSRPVAKAQSPTQEKSATAPKTKGTPKSKQGDGT